MTQATLKIYSGDTDPRIAALGESWIRVGDITFSGITGSGDDPAAVITAEIGSVITAEGECTIPRVSKTERLYRRWVIRVTGSKHDVADLAIQNGIGGPYSTGSVSVYGATLESVTSRRDGTR